MFLITCNGEVCNSPRKSNFYEIKFINDIRSRCGKFSARSNERWCARDLRPPSWTFEHKECSYVSKHNE